jgi:hypothetical protein
MFGGRMEGFYMKLLSSCLFVQKLLCLVLAVCGNNKFFYYFCFCFLLTNGILIVTQTNKYSPTQLTKENMLSLKNTQELQL